MKLSDAMRRADEIGLPDLRRKFVQWDTANWGGEKPPCCAIGGANIASGRVRIVPVDGHVPQEQRTALMSIDGFQVTAGLIKCPVGRREIMRMETIVMQLYDRHGWSRTRIADWLDTLDVPA